MTRLIFIHGALAGLITIGAMTLGIVLSNGEGAGSSMLVGYLIMLVALALIFIGVKRHRDRDLGGVIKFLPAFLVGLGIAAVAGVFYVIGWEAYLASTDYAYMSEYTAKVIADKRAAGITGAELDEVIRNLAALTEQYRNPVFRLPMTFLEIFPVGLLVALISAAVLRNPRVLPAR